MPTRRLELAALAVATLLWAARAEAQSPYGIGRAATPAEIAGWNIDVGGDGSNLPPGIGSVSHGSEVFAQQCAACHGAKGEGGVGDRLVGGQGTLGSQSRCVPSEAIGHTRRRCSITSAAPCRRTHRNHSATTTSMRCLPIFLASTACCRRMRRLMPSRLPRSRCPIATCSLAIPGRTSKTRNACRVANVACRSAAIARQRQQYRTSDYKCTS